MGLIRLAIILLIAWLIYRLTRRWLAVMKQKNISSANTGGEQITTMVRCEHCGLHIPQQEALQSGGKHYCSLDHIQEHKERDHNEKDRKQQEHKNQSEES